MSSPLKIVLGRHKWIYISLFAITLVLGLFWFYGSSVRSYDDLFANLFAGSISTLIPLFFIDLILEVRAEGRNSKLQRIGLAHVSYQLGRFQELIQSQYKDVTGNDISSAPEELFTLEVAETICNGLSVIKQAPIITQRVGFTWEDYLPQFAQSFKEELNGILLKYGLYLPEEVIDKVERLRGSGLVEEYRVLQSIRRSRIHHHLEASKLFIGSSLSYCEIFQQVLDLRVQVEG